MRPSASGVPRAVAMSASRAPASALRSPCDAPGAREGQELALHRAESAHRRLVCFGDLTEVDARLPGMKEHVEPLVALAPRPRLRPPGLARPGHGRRARCTHCGKCDPRARAGSPRRASMIRPRHRHPRRLRRPSRSPAREPRLRRRAAGSPAGRSRCPWSRRARRRRWPWTRDVAPVGPALERIALRAGAVAARIALRREPTRAEHA